MRFKVSTIKMPTLKVQLFWQHKDGMRLRLLEAISYYRRGEPSDDELLEDIAHPKLGKEMTNRKEIFIPTGYVSDGATIPKIFWSLLAPFEDYTKCCILHDYLCDLFHLGYIKQRKTCDAIFLEAMEEIGIKKSTRLTLYVFVRLFGMLRYNKLSIKYFGRGEVEDYNKDFFKDIADNLNAIGEQ